MRKGIHVKGLNDGELVHVTGHIRQGIRAPEAGLSVLFEHALCAKQLGLLDLATANLHVHLLAVVLLQLRLVVEQIHLRWPTIHVEVNAGFCLGRKMARSRSQWIYQCRGGSCPENLVTRENPGEGNSRH